ncbi:putative RNA recognition motif domain, nucleotide-binding alpha-beta plait domain superfamily [Helianthus annuus]|uniref:RNA recognition motif domain, nucleotide-binding alpha-beta plait domain superfamily n=1 Tax=Helianthus annuus TaxID=4232 RepID=A0A9K3NCA2_HELAN|nr:putative RNA recognition motif domain, nucleotide-binding alpha-beta plait domain superfamily [Helianthus annuus]KAJ0718463.1 putative RNA recognition motif domain, nucleotide-binding alpha-beta plait domain superfamily [Helianthus annuus]
MASRYGREGDSGDGGPWSNVQYRKNRKSKGDGIEWTFLVQNLSDRVSRNVLWRSFQPFGFVSDVYVARKRDARGKCFGFVRYVGVENMKDTLAKLNNIKMFDMKVSVSLAKYDKDHNRFNYAPESLGRKFWRPKEDARDNGKQTHDARYGEQPQVEKHVSGNSASGPSFVQEGKSYADLLKGNKGTMVDGAKVVNVEGKGSLYPLHCIGRSIIGYTKEVMTVRNVRMFMEKHDLSDVGLSYVGGVTFMLTFKDKSSAREYMNSLSVLFHEIFSNFFLWNGEDIPFNRVAKINVVGVPFIIRDNSLFDRIGGMFGEVIKQSSFSWQNEDNSSGSVTVITEQKSRVDEDVVIKWNNKSIVAWVSEDSRQYPNNEDDELNMENDDSEDESESDSEEEPAEEEVFEEGEVRPIVDAKKVNQVEDHVPVPEVGVDIPMGDSDSPPVGIGKSPVAQGSHVVVESPGLNVNMGNNDMHGESQQMHGEFQTPACTRNYNCNNGGREVLSDDVEVRGGSHENLNQDSGCGSDIMNKTNGPFIPPSLGKWARDQRSPPSVGSVQGPQVRACHDNNPLQDNSPEVNIPGQDRGPPENVSSIPIIPPKYGEVTVLRRPSGNADSFFRDTCVGSPLARETDATIQRKHGN